MSSWFTTVFFGKYQRQFWRQTIAVACVASPLFFLWLHYKDEIANQREYVVTQDSIFVLDPPPWFSKVILDEALKLLPPEYQNKPLVAFDPNLVDALIAAFKAHPMILDVESVVCQYPALVKVRLVFRTPVAVVDATPESAEQFLDDVRRRAPKEYALALDAFQRDNPNAIDETIENRNDGRKRKLRPEDFYLVDADGEETPKQYFIDHPDSYRTLPQILGITDASVKKSPNGAKMAIREAAALIRFLQEENAIRRYNITTVYAFRKDKEQHARFIVKAPTDGRNAAFISWGAFAPPQRREGESGRLVYYDSETVKQLGAETENPTLSLHKAKLQSLDEQVKKTAYALDVCESSIDMAERVKIPELLNPNYDLSQVIVAEEKKSTAEKEEIPQAADAQASGKRKE